MDEVGARHWLTHRFGEDKVAKLAEFIARLTAENSTQNLVSVASLNESWARHILDSAQLIEFVPRETGTWLDIGSGAGFPGLIVGCVSSFQVTLCEPRARRADWLSRTIVDLGITNCGVADQRIEKVPAFEADVISARAYAPLPKLVATAARFSTKDTTWVLPKGGSAAQELQSLTGWKHTFHVEQSLSNQASGIIVGQLLAKKASKP